MVISPVLRKGEIPMFKDYLGNKRQRKWTNSCQKDQLFDVYVTHLEDRQYQSSTIEKYLQSLAHYTSWKDTHRLSSRLSEHDLIEHFLTVHLSNCHCPPPARKQVKTMQAALNQYLKVLGETRFTLFSNPDLSRSINNVVQDYDAYLKDVCGLAESTRFYRRRYIGGFLKQLFGERRVLVSKIDADAVVSFIKERADRYTAASTAVVACSLQNFLKYLVFRGTPAAIKEASIPRRAAYTLSSLPKTLSREQLSLFLDAFDCNTPKGKRDYAMAVCMVGLGLRAREVADLRLDHIDWRKSTIELSHQKAKRVDLIPLTSFVGKAMIDYLQNGRPKTSCQYLFVYHKAPVGEKLAVMGVRHNIRSGFERAGLSWATPHMLRHTVATLLLEDGQSIKAVADVLRHRCIDTTRIYTKIDFQHLDLVAMPWPGGEI